MGDGIARRADASLHDRIGERLRAVRRDRRLSLEDVQAASGGEFKISALGSYERGQRGIGVHRLLRLAEIYEVDPCVLLPDSSTRTPSVAHGDPAAKLSPVGVGPSPPTHTDRRERRDRYPGDAVL